MEKQYTVGICLSMGIKLAIGAHVGAQMRPRSNRKSIVCNLLDFDHKGYH